MVAGVRDELNGAVEAVGEELPPADRFVPPEPVEERDAGVPDKLEAREWHLGGLPLDRA